MTFVPGIEFAFVDEASPALEGVLVGMASIALELALRTRAAKRRTILPATVYAIEVH